MRERVEQFMREQERLRGARRPQDQLEDESEKEEEEP